MRKKEISETSLRKYAASLEQSRIDKNLGPGNVSNIGIVQTATPPGLDGGKKLKVCGGMLASGFFGGLLWAFLLELVLSPAIKRPSDVSDKLKLPLFLWIPEISRNGKSNGKLAAASRLITDNRSLITGSTPTSGSSTGSAPSTDSAPDPASLLTTDNRSLITGSSPLSSSPEMRHYYEALRDRLINYFEIKNMTHKPKLVAITSCSRGAGVSTIAAGVAALFSETGDGNVLLVDMNLDQSGGAAAHPFHRGKPGCSLTEALQQEKRENALVSENLYMASVGEDHGKLSSLMPKKFGNLVPRMKASDYDYIIFDMPPVSQTSITTRLAAKMDINLVVIAAEEDATPKVQEAVAFLKESGANVGGVLNRRQFHVPKKLRHEIC
jgi:Mrp family chromosome partitioning ATPase